MSTTELKISRSKQKKEQYAFNRQFIQHIAKLNDEQYNQIQYDLGLKFLATEFPLTSKYADLNAMHERNRGFWDWWIAEWCAFEAKIFQDYKGSDFKIVDAIWYIRMERIVADRNVSNSFYHNYIVRTPVW